MKKQSPKIINTKLASIWRKEKLRNIAPLRGGFAFKSEKFQNTGIPIVRISNIKFDGTVGGEFECYSKIISDEKFVLRGRSILLAMSGATTGKIAMLDSEEEYYQNQRVGYFQNTGEVDYDFLSSVLQTKAFTNQLNGVLVAGAQPNISSKEIDSFEFCIPDSIDEQSAIGSLFRTLDDLLASYKDNLINYQSLKATMLSKMFPKAGQRVPEIRLDGFEGEWEIVKLGDNCRIITGGTPRTGVKEFWNPKEIPWMSSGEINKKILNETEEKISCIGLENSSAKWVKQNSVLIALAGQGQTRGRVAINKIPLTTNQSIAAIETNSNIDFLFLYTDLGRRYDELRLISSGDGTRGGLNKMIISRLELNIPSIEEQQAIGSYFSNLDNLINSHQEKISQLETLKKKLLQDMFI